MSRSLRNHDAGTCGAPGELLLSVEEALEILCQSEVHSAEKEEVDIVSAQDRILADDIFSPIDVPGHDNSAMDGYAVRSTDFYGAELPVRLRVAQRIPAGHVGGQLNPGCGARIFTGAPLPPGADAVVMQEECRSSGDWVEIARPVAAGENVRPRGNDIEQDRVILHRGQRLRPQDVALAASVGCRRLPVYPRLKVGILSTGNELIQPGKPLSPGKIYNSNRYLLTGLLHALGCEVRDAGITHDDLHATQEALQTLSSGCALIVTTGGVSVGEEDHVKPAVERLGRLDMWRIAMKPGKPLAFGSVADSLFIGLPGNPVSAFVTFALLARPLIRKLQGMKDTAVPARQVVAGFNWTRSIGRREYVRVRIEKNGKGEEVATLYPNQGSDVLSSVVWAHGLVEIPAGHTFSSGENVQCIPFCELFP